MKVNKLNNSIKQHVLFTMLLSIIFALDFCIFKNMDRLIPKHENEVYTFSNKSSNEDLSFLYELYEQINIQDKYESLSQDDIDEIINNKVLYNLITKQIYRNGITEKYFEKELLSFCDKCEFYNTVYGNLKSIAISGNYAIVYSENMEKIYYVDAEVMFHNLYEIDYYDAYGGKSKNISVTEAQVNISGDNFDEKTEAEKEINKAEIIQNAKEIFSNIFFEKEFEPETLIYTGKYYILKDSNRDITIYYNKEDNIIFGLYIGFGK